MLKSHKLHVSSGGRIDDDGHDGGRIIVDLSHCGDDGDHTQRSRPVGGAHIPLVLAGLDSRAEVGETWVGETWEIYS